MFRSLQFALLEPWLLLITQIDGALLSESIFQLDWARFEKNLHWWTRSRKIRARHCTFKERIISLCVALSNYWLLLGLEFDCCQTINGNEWGRSIFHFNINGWGILAFRLLLKFAGCTYWLKSLQRANVEKNAETVLTFGKLWFWCRSLAN